MIENHSFQILRLIARPMVNAKYKHMLTNIFTMPIDSVFNFQLLINANGKVFDLT